MRDEVEYVPYYGYMKGSLWTMWEGAGNDFDQAALISDLLRAAGYETRFVIGTVEVEPAYMKQVLGVNTTEEALQMLWENYVPAEIENRKILIEHTWVEAYIPYSDYRGYVMDEGNRSGWQWVPIDGAFVPYNQKEPYPPVADIDYNLTSVFEQTLQNGTYGEDYFTGLNFSGLDFATEELMNLTDEWYDQNMASVVGGLTKEEIIALYADKPPEVESTIIPGTTPYSPIVFEMYTEVPDEFLHIINFKIVENQRTTLSINIPTTILAGKQLTLDYVPANEEIAELANAQDFLNETPAYLYDFKPILRLNSIAIEVGEASQFGTEGELQITIKTPNNMEMVSSPVVVGDYYAIGADLGKMPSEHIGMVWDNTLEGIIEGGTMVLDHSIGGYMSLTLGNYFGMVDRTNDIAADALGVRWWRNSPAIAVFGHTFNVGYIGSVPTTITEGYSHIDVTRNTLSIAGNDISKMAFVMHAGSVSSIFEGEIFEMFYNVSGFSTANVFEIAIQDGIPIYYLNSDNLEVLNGLNLPDEVRTSITNSIINGYEVFVPSQQITHDDWTGVGWIVLDPDTGASAWMIGNDLGTIINGGDGNPFHGQEAVDYTSIDSTNENQVARIQREIENGIEGDIEKTKKANPTSSSAKQISKSKNDILNGLGILGRAIYYKADSIFNTNIKSYVDDTLDAIESRKIADIAYNYGDDKGPYIKQAAELEKKASREIKNARAAGATRTGAKVFNSVLVITGLGLVAQKTTENVLSDIENKKYGHAAIDLTAGVVKGSVTGAAFYADVAVARKVSKVPHGRAIGLATSVGIAYTENALHKGIDKSAGIIKSVYGAVRYG